MPGFEFLYDLVGSVVRAIRTDPDGEPVHGVIRGKGGVEFFADDVHFVVGGKQQEDPRLGAVSRPDVRGEGPVPRFPANHAG